MLKARNLFRPSKWTRRDLKNGSVFFIGTATTLIRYAGFTILTDPNFLHKGERVRLGYGLRSTRRTDPAMNVEDLPAIDLVVLSHMHEDHFDRVAERDLDKTLPILTTPHAARALERKGFGAARALKTWQTRTFVKGTNVLHVTATPGRHAPGLLAKLLPPVMGSLLEFQSEAGANLLRMYITGDTLVYKDLKEIPARYPGIDLALLHLGGTRVVGLMVTMDGKQGVEALKIVAPTVAIPIHYNDYTAFKSPLEDFEREVRKAGLEDRVRYLSHGETYGFEIPESRIR